MAIFNSYVSLPEGNDQIRRYGSISPTAKPCFHEMWYPWPSRSLSRKQSKSPLLRDSFHTWTSKSCILFWSGLKSSERPKIEQLLNLPSVSHIWKDQKYDTKWRRKNQLFDTQTVSLNPSLLAQKWFLGPHPKIHKDQKLCGSRTVQVYMYMVTL